jgi:DNA-binding NtrC family response regulator
MRSLATTTRASAAEPIGLVVSLDGDLVRRVRGSCAAGWTVEELADGASLREAVGRLDVGLVVLDDERIPEADRAALMADLRVWFPRAPIVYVASAHSAGVERCARAGGIVAYTSKPLDGERLGRLVRGITSRRNPPRAA